MELTDAIGLIRKDLFIDMDFDMDFFTLFCYKELIQPDFTDPKSSGRLIIKI